MHDQDEAEEIEFIIHTSEDSREVTIVLKSKTPMSANAVMLELEYYINQVSRAEAEMAEPGALKH